MERIWKIVISVGIVLILALLFFWITGFFTPVKTLG